MSGRGEKRPSPSARSGEGPGAPERDRAPAVEGAPTTPQIEVAGPFLARVPTIALSRAELNAADLDHREYFLVSLMDAFTTVEMLLDICGMPAEEALTLLESLEQRGIISLEG